MNKKTDSENESVFSSFSLQLRTFVTNLRTFVTVLRTFVTNSEIPPRYLYYIQRNFEGLGETENKDYKITFIPITDNIDIKGRVLNSSNFVTKYQVVVTNKQTENNLISMELSSIVNNIN